MSGRLRHRAIIGPTSDLSQAVLDHLCPPAVRASPGGMVVGGFGRRVWNRGAEVRCAHAPRDHVDPWGARFIRRADAEA